MLAGLLTPSVSGVGETTDESGYGLSMVCGDIGVVCAESLVSTALDVKAHTPSANAVDRGLSPFWNVAVADNTRQFLGGSAAVAFAAVLAFPGV